ncbi:DUF6034 family protein [Muricomes intestini]|jgi:hypothetical protein|uniref:Lipoprotein n=1 Tax=Muricomes intestini TaxID=1796634 RepID=A0A4R3K584_9FIRM|nr:DUF6034 family protein [Muricomes intestini]TCS77929.1 hypothetical protein EDD59_11485 [Muricomes intestini]HAX51507.1 hypothetical protein [Lachnospiraceae bacterium]HCR84516.1 hypothetical protein [Lachnospiraceae bacterium]
MQKTNFGVSAAVIISLGLSACQKTPENDAVINKKEGLAERFIEKGSDNVKLQKLGAPEEWKEKYGENTDMVTIETDVKIELPHIKNTPVWEMKEKKISNEELVQLADYFSEGEKIYQEPEMTTADLTELKRKIENKEGKYGNPIFLRPGEAQEKTLYLQRVDDLIAKAKETESEKIYLSPKFIKVVQSQEEYIRRGKDDRTIRTEKNRFAGIIENGENQGAKILAVQKNDKAGSTSNFFFQKGTEFDDYNGDYMDSIREAADQMKMQDSEWMKKAESVKAVVENIKKSSRFSKEEAGEKAKLMFRQINAPKMVLEDFEPTVWSPENKDMWEVDWSTGEAGYRLYYYRGIEGIPAYWANGITYDTPEQTYSPPFGQECIEVLVTETGIKQVDWYNMSEKVKTVAENTKLLSFDEIKTRAFQHLKYTIVKTTTDQDVKSSSLKVPFVISDVRFRYAYIPAQETLENAWLVPVWVFVANSKYVESQNGQVFETEKPTDEFLINALDGSYIDANAYDVVRMTR